MSNQKATGGFHRDEQFSSLVIMSGRDCAPGRFLSQQSPDLWVKGGSLIEKTLCVGGNIGVEGFLIGNVCSELVLVSQIQEKFFGEGIIVSGNLMMQPDDYMYVSSIRSHPGKDLCLSAAPNQSVTICGGNCLDLNSHDICNAGNIDATSLDIEELNLQCGNITNVNTITISRLEGSNCNGTEVSIVSDAYLLQEAQVGGNLFVDNNSIFYGDICNFGETILKGNVTMDAELSVGGNLFADINGTFSGDLCVLGDSSLKGNASVDLELLVDGSTILGHTLQMSNVTGNGKILFDDSIVIGNISSSASASNSIVIGKDATVSVENGIGIGQGADVSGNAGVAIGFSASVKVDDGVAIGTNATTSTVGNAIAIGVDAGVFNIDAAHPLALGLSSGITVETIASTHTLGVVIGGVQYKLLLSNL